MKTNVSPTIFNLTLGRQGSIIYLPLDFKCRALEYVQCGRDDWQYWTTCGQHPFITNPPLYYCMYVYVYVHVCVCMCTMCMYV